MPIDNMYGESQFMHFWVDILIMLYHTVYNIGIAMVFVFPPYIREIQSFFQFQVNSTSDDYTVYIEHVKTKLCINKIPLPLPIRAKHIFLILSMFFFFFFFFFSLNSRNSITVIPIHIKLGI